MTLGSLPNYKEWGEGLPSPSDLKLVHPPSLSIWRAVQPLMPAKAKSVAEAFDKQIQTVPDFYDLSAL